MIFESSINQCFPSADRSFALLRMTAVRKAAEIQMGFLPL